MCHTFFAAVFLVGLHQAAAGALPWAQSVSAAAAVGIVLLLLHCSASCTGRHLTGAWLSIHGEPGSALMGGHATMPPRSGQHRHPEPQHVRHVAAVGAHATAAQGHVESACAGHAGEGLRDEASMCSLMELSQGLELPLSAHVHADAAAGAAQAWAVCQLHA